MKAVRALDASGDGIIYGEEFQRLYMTSKILAAEEAVNSSLESSYLLAIRTKVIDMWKAIGGPAGQVERLACWDLILADDELATLMGNGDKGKGKAMLEIMKAVRSLDMTGTGIIYEKKFQRLYLPSAILAAKEAIENGLSPAYLEAIRVKVVGMWKAIGKKGHVERLACWDFILADDELATLMGNGELNKGKAMLESMKAVRALDASGDGTICDEEFQRLYLPYNILAAESAYDAGFSPSYLEAIRVKVIKMWKVIGKKGQVERLACWDFILADDELASIMGKGDKSIGKSMLESMKSVRALDVNRDDMIVESEFQRLYLSSALTAAIAAVTSN